MEFRVLGPLEVLRTGEVVEVRGSKRRALLGLLILHANEVLRTDHAIDELWGEHPPANARTALHNHVSRLRKDLGTEVLLTKPGGYELRAEPERIDLHRFESLVQEAKRLPARDRRVKLAEALALWRGSALAGLEQEPSLAVEIARLEDLRLSALERRIDADLELGESEQLLPELEGLVAAHPLRERPRGLLILALYRSGRQAEALESYRETRRVLVQELGIEPGPELRELERAILRQDPALASVAAPVAVPGEEAQPSRRRPLVLGLALALLLLGGTAAAVVVTEGDPSPKPVALRAPHAAPSSVDDEVAAHALGPATTLKLPSPTKPRASSAKSRVAQAEHVVQGATPPPPPAAQRPHERRPAAAPPPPPPPAPPPPAPPPPPAHKTPPPSPRRQWVYWLNDNFTDPAVNYGLWGLETGGSGIESVEQNGRLEFSIAPSPAMDSTHAVARHYGTRCFLKGDFDATVGYSLLTWPAADGVHLSFGAWFPPPKEDFLAIDRIGGTPDGPEYYGSGIVANASALTEDTRGALRIKRSEGVLGVYYRNGKSWKRLAWKWAPAPTALVLMLWTNDALFGHQRATAAVDNFTAVADDVVCHGAPLPPRKRVR